MDSLQFGMKSCTMAFKFDIRPAAEKQQLGIISTFVKMSKPRRIRSTLAAFQEPGGGSRELAPGPLRNAHETRSEHATSLIHALAPNSQPTLPATAEYTVQWRRFFQHA